MKAYIILSVGNGLLESKPILCGSYYPPRWIVPKLQSYDLQRFAECANTEAVLPVPVGQLVFQQTGNWRLLAAGVTARIYELETL